MKSFLTSKFIKYIQSIVIDEKLSEIAIITSANISKLVDNISGNFDSLNVYNKINDFCGSAEIFFIFPDFVLDTFPVVSFYLGLFFYQKPPKTFHNKS